MENNFGKGPLYVFHGTKEPFTGCCTDRYDRYETGYYENGKLVRKTKLDSSGQKVWVCYYTKKECSKLDSVWDTPGLYSVRKHGWYVLGHEQKRYYRSGLVVRTERGKDRTHLINYTIDKTRMHIKELDSLGRKKTNMIYWDRTKDLDHGFRSRGFDLYFRKDGKRCLSFHRTGTNYYRNGCIVNERSW
jgi:hypothetical protein